MSDRYAVIGNPIDFSKSPLIHMGFAQATGQDIDYSKLLGPLGQFAATVDRFRQEGGRGLNVTAPFKLDACQYASQRSAAATVFAPHALAYELAYGKGLTPLLRLARNAGVQHLADGVGMLAEQAAEAFAWWRGVRPDTREVIAQLTVALQ